MHVLMIDTTKALHRGLHFVWDAMHLLIAKNKGAFQYALHFVYLLIAETSERVIVHRTLILVRCTCSSLTLTEHVIVRCTSS